MTTSRRDARVDAYIEKSAPFARPILERLREIVHSACPDAVETIKWGMPFFESAGRPLCHMAAFKQHAAFAFWLGQLVTGEDSADAAMGQFGRLTSPADLPPKKTLVARLKKAAALNAAGVKSPTRSAAGKTAPKSESPLPESLAQALAGSAKSRRQFAALSPGQRREYAEWIGAAKREETRTQRVATTIAQINEGKALHWKYRKT